MGSFFLLNEFMYRSLIELNQVRLNGLISEGLGAVSTKPCAKYLSLRSKTIYFSKTAKF
jgi:hypothetical protein